MAARTPRRVLLALALAALSAPLVTGLSGAGAAASGGGAIHPGGEVNFGDVSCEIGAVMHQGHTVYLAVPASCGGIDAGKPQPNGCYGPLSPVGVPVSIEGAKHHGQLVYSSFTEMQRHGVTSHDRCYYNDLDLVRVNRHDRHLVTAAIPGTGAPTHVLATLPKSGTALRVGTGTGTAGATEQGGWVLNFDTMAMLKTANVGAPITVGKSLVGMLVVLPKGPLPMAPLLQSPAQVFNLSRAIHELHKFAKFRHVTLVHAGTHPW